MDGSQMSLEASFLHLADCVIGGAGVSVLGIIVSAMAATSWLWAGEKKFQLRRIERLGELGNDTFWQDERAAERECHDFKKFPVVHGFLDWVR